ncbi:MAG: alpha/beta fold hydrolase [Sphingorhabdus sp.]
MPMATTRDGTKLFYKDWGKGDPVVLIHGWPLSSDSWDNVSLALVEAGYRVVAYDRRGFGRSDQPGHGYNYDIFADDLADIMEAAGIIENATLVGFSMGGGEVARYMSLHNGKGVKRSALIGSIVPFVLQTKDNPDGVPQSKLDQIMQDLRDDRHAFMRSFLDQFFGVGWISKPVSDEVLDASFAMTLQAGMIPIIKAAQAWSSTDFRPDLASFTCPTLIIHGTADANVPIDPTARAAAEMLPKAWLIEYEGEPHGLYETERDRLIGDLLNFMQTTDYENDRPAIGGTMDSSDPRIETNPIGGAVVTPI